MDTMRICHTKTQQGNVVHGVCEVFMDEDLVDSDPDLINTNITASKANSDLMMTQPPLQILSIPPVMEAQYDREGSGRQQLLVVFVVQAVGCRQGKSVANLRGQVKIYLKGSFQLKF